MYLCQQGNILLHHIPYLLLLLSDLILLPASLFTIALVSFSNGNVIVSPPLTYNLAVLNPHNAVGKLGNFVVVGNHHNGLVKFPASTLEQT